MLHCLTNKFMQLNASLYIYIFFYIDMEIDFQ